MSPVTIALLSLAVAVLMLIVAVVGATFGYVLASDRRTTRNEERIASLGRQLQSLPKRKTDS